MPNDYEQKQVGQLELNYLMAILSGHASTCDMFGPGTSWVL